MKKLLVFIGAVLVCAVAFAQTVSIDWKVDGSTYAQNTCEYGGTLTVPTQPTKYGYTFQGWRAIYTRIEYIESTGTQWIDTGIIAKSSIKAEFVVDRPVPPARGTSWRPLASMEDATNGIFKVAESTNSYGGKYIALQYGKTSVSEIITESWVASGFNQSKFVLDGGILTVDNGAHTITSPQAGQTFNSGHNLRLFLPEGKTNSANCTMYYMKLWDGDILVRDFIPVLDGAGTPCMYDKVTQQFFYNQGTGDFIAGPMLYE